MTAHRRFTAKQRREIALIEEALGKSDARLHRYARSLAQFDRTAARESMPDLSAQRARILDKIRSELLEALQRLGAIDTGLHAQEDLRQALIASAAGYAAWSFALNSQNFSEIAAARTRMQRHFDVAVDHGERGASRLAKGV